MAAAISLLLAAPYVPIVVTDVAANVDIFDRLITVLIFGTLIGLAIGVPQYFVLRRHTSRAWAWIVDNVVGGITAAALFVTVSSEQDYLVIFPLFCLCSPIMFALITGSALYGIVYRGDKKKKVDGEIFS